MRGVLADTFWTDERVARLKEMWANGEPPTVIMRALGAISRNQVIGKVHRLGLMPCADRPVRAPRLTKPVHQQPPLTQPEPKRTAFRVPTTIAKPDPIGPMNSFPDGDGCRFIEADPALSPWRCCGAPQVHEMIRWCDYHAPRCFQSHPIKTEKAKAR